MAAVSPIRLVCLLALLAFVATTSAVTAGCGDKKKKGETAEDVPALSDKNRCETNADCQSGWVCLSNRCADPTMRGLGSGNGVTPDKVKKQVEDVAKQADERGQKALDL